MAPTVENRTPPKLPTWQVTQQMRERSRALRRDATRAEQIIWRFLRAHRMEGVGFRRQTPIGPYIVDFVSYAAMLVIEIDGGQHFEDAYLKKDARRDAFLRSKGFRVLRFNNHDVIYNREGVWEMIAAALVQAPSLALPRKRGRGQGGASDEAGA